MEKKAEYLVGLKEWRILRKMLELNEENSNQNMND